MKGASTQPEGSADKVKSGGHKVSPPRKSYAIKIAITNIHKETPMLTDNSAAMLILVVEDDDSHAELVRRSFESLPEEYRLHVAGCLHDARQVMEIDTPCLVLTDFRLPDGDGCDLVKMVSGACPVVMMTSQGNEQLAVDAMKAGIMDYVVKSEAAFSAVPHIAKRAIREWSCIQARQQAENRLNEQVHFLHQLLDALPTPVYYKDTDGLYRGCNLAFENFLGLPKEKIVGRTVFDVVPKALANAFHEADSSLFALPGLQTYEGGVMHKDGTQHEVIFNKATYIGADGRVAGIVGAMLDITDRKRAEELLHKREQEFRALAENAPDLIFRFDRDCRCVYVNPAVERLTGKQASCLLGKTPREGSLLSPSESDQWGRSLRQVLETGLPFDCEVEYVAPNGQQIHFHNRSGAVRGRNGEVTGVMSILRDITERHFMQNELIKIQRLESLGVLAGGIAHDFNNILTGILGNISFARIFLDESHRVAKILLEAEKASERAADLASQLLTFAKGGRPIKKTASAGKIVSESASFCLSGTKVSSVIDLSEDLYPVEVDEGQINQVFNNIIINAVQAMPDGGTITITAKNLIVDDSTSASIAPGGYVKISFADTGCGMSDDIRNRIFEPYFTTKSEGHGLGLASVYSIVNKHGGHISVRSMPGKGTTFDVLLPAGDKKTLDHKEDMMVVTVGEHDGSSLLVMDDDEIIRNMTAEMLGALGYRVQTCANGEEAIALYRAALEAGTAFSAVIMDLTVPGGMGGKEAARYILNIDPAACLIVSSGYSNDPVLAEYSNCGFSAALVKPYSLSKMAQVLKELQLHFLV